MNFNVNVLVIASSWRRLAMSADAPSLQLLPLPGCFLTAPITVNLQNMTQSWTVGRKGVGLKLPEDKRLSSIHFGLQLAPGGGVLIVDISTNGTFINGSRIPKGESQPLSNGDTVTCVVASASAAALDDTLSASFVGFSVQLSASIDTSKLLRM